MTSRFIILQSAGTSSAVDFDPEIAQNRQQLQALRAIAIELERARMEHGFDRAEAQRSISGNLRIGLSQAEFPFNQVMIDVSSSAPWRVTILKRLSDGTPAAISLNAADFVSMGVSA